MFNINLLRYEIIGHVLVYCYGHMYSFKRQICLDLKYDALRWNIVKITSFLLCISLLPFQPLDLFLINLD